MGQRTIAICTAARSVIVRAFGDVALCTVVSNRAVAKCSERTTNGSRRRYIDVGIGACILGAVAAKEMLARRNAMVS